MGDPGHDGAIMIMTDKITNIDKLVMYLTASTTSVVNPCMG
jgi:hypothetical protein